MATLSDLKLDTRNARRRGQRASGLLEASLQEVGAARSIVIDENNRILAGNGTVEAAGQVGIDRVQIVEADGETIVAVRRRGLTEAQKQRLALLDNRTADLAEWDPQVLAALVDEGLQMGDLWSNEELEAMIAADGVTVEPGDGGDEFDATPDEGPTRCQPGDLWILGPHRLVCGDCTDAEVVARVMGGKKADMMLTDPPYGVAYVGRTPDAMTLAGDDVDEDAIGRMWTGCCDGARMACREGAYWFATVPAGPLHLVFADDWKRRGVLRQIMVWVKNSLVLGHSEYHYRHEPILFGWMPGDRRRSADRTKDTVWEYDRPSASRDHPTMKPVELWMRPMTDMTVTGDVIYDPFLGSGTTVIAAHRTGRVCYGCEIEPRYCDVILRRYEAETGEKATRFD